MSQRQKIEPQRITKPIQLLAAWLVGLIIVNGSFLGAAIAIETPVWLRSTLVIAAVLNVPIFLICLFLLQTRFRPEMQEDLFYHEYLIAKDGRDKSRPHETLESAPKEKGGIWDGYSIMLNQNIEGAQAIDEELKSQGIPITSYFGGPAGLKPPGLTASIGRGFSDEQIKKLVRALSQTSITHIDYAADEEKPDEYTNIILIGSWVPSYETHSVPIGDALNMVNEWAFAADKFYSEIIIAHESGNS
ncbi:hypothetical protein [Vibrio ostreae]|uniref:Uncharacterized protein n=2 Tax=Vibrio ostreae TaxID=2841925 RepID=A0A975U6E5_9VIBR|nr:hypothetical protein [Vibrio ostreae]QXO16015.1 hypothetical protein KNV97_00300 [Vibrio ostreae]